MLWRFLTQTQCLRAPNTRLDRRSTHIRRGFQTVGVGRAGEPVRHHRKSISDWGMPIVRWDVPSQHAAHLPGQLLDHG